MYPSSSSRFLQSFVQRMAEVATNQKALLDEVKTEGEKFGEDIKHLADFTAGVKKFEPWIEKSEVFYRMI